ncbi:MAG: pyridoxal phosphate-dependent aminotransferase [Chitinophagales bacterium]|nr:pyridoxal phosphate-dependent aminotransferase [Chitinophagales bacterium]
MYGVYIFVITMPTPSNRGLSMPSSPIRKLTPFAEQAKKNGIHIYHLNIGQPDIETPQEFWDAVKNINLKVLAYSPSSGFDDLRIEYAKYFSEKRGLPHINFEDILITTGASEALLFTMLSIFDAGDEIIGTEPLYANYVGYAKSAGVIMKAITTHFEDQFSLPSIDDFEKAISERTKAILICNPNNPTGYRYSDDELDRLKDIALKHNIFIISDEVYREFSYSDIPYKSMLSYPEIEQNVIMIDSMSKKYSACGARIGTVVTKNKDVLDTILKFAQQRLSPPTVEQIGSKALFNVNDEYFKIVNKEYILRRDTLVDGLNSIKGVKCHSPKGAFYCMVQLPIRDSDHFCQWILESFSYEGGTVMMAPGTGFYSTEGLGKNEVRMAYVLQVEELKKAVRCLEKGLEKYQLLFPEFAK